MRRLVGLLATLLMFARSVPIGAESEWVVEALPIRIDEVTPSFRACSVGPEFMVKVRNVGHRPISVHTLVNAVIVEARGVKYGGPAVFANVLPSNIPAGGDWTERVTVGWFAVPLAPGENTLTIWIAGNKSAPVRFDWQPASASGTPDNCLVRGPE